MGWSGWDVNRSGVGYVVERRRSERLRPPIQVEARPQIESAVHRSRRGLPDDPLPRFSLHKGHEGELGAGPLPTRR
jgi:hypothetical protein